MSSYTDRCKTCRHWIRQGKDPWDFGRCYNLTDWAEIAIHGDAWAEVEISPEFGCILHELLNEEIK